MADSILSRSIHNARDKEEKREQERRRNLLYLIVDFLKEQRFTECADALAKEAHLSKDVKLCDNIDLDIVLLEYSDYYYAKYQRYPKICKKVESAVESNFVHNQPKKERTVKNSGRLDGQSSDDKFGKSKSSTSENNTGSEIEPIFAPIVTPIFQRPKNQVGDVRLGNNVESLENERILKPLQGLYESGTEWREIAEMIAKEIVQTNLNVKWEDIYGLEECKETLKQATVFPIKYPEVFSGKFSPWQGILLYGPSGTGKTMLAKAVATECNMTFFNITSSSIVSKWRGDSEKYVRVLCDLAKYHAPSVIFVDEIDWTVTKNSGSSSTLSEPARRFRAELLARLDGLLSNEKSRILFLAATNMPWDLDVALLRRLEKRILVNVPDSSIREAILVHYVSDVVRAQHQFSQLIIHTDGYSCADLKLLCKEAWMRQVKKLFYELQNNPSFSVDLKSKQTDTIHSMKYLMDALAIVKPIAKDVVEKYEAWNKVHTEDNLKKKI
ncbi:katanin p60 ATPase-containing subunit A-like 2 [Cephus cinctus]|uniref:Katanin p60 ATPase-containing subunit A-like 2 n=1 Tax=Cephus cinctus TaxID=211228 RepID=A0AAJ7FSW1_CEPCN|nr:katanin p60 ATPase-containing subunit A-like 2 [Cephus cinctus]